MVSLSVLMFGRVVRNVVTYSTFQKWQRDFDKELNILMWLGCETCMEKG